MGKHKRRFRTNRTLQDKLAKIPDNSIVKIGSKNCFMYCYYKNQLTEQRLKEIDTKNLKQLNHLILKNSEKGNDKLVARYQAKLKTYKPLLERYVVKSFKSDIEDNTYIIVVSGSETGNYWNIDEYAYHNKLFIALTDRHYPQERLHTRRLNYGY